jgi:hypothetical protein
MKSLISCKARSIRFSLHHCFSKSGPEIISWHPGLPKNVAPRFAANSVSHTIPASSYTANEREGNTIHPTSMKAARNELFSKGVINGEKFDQFVREWIPRSSVAGYAAFMMHSGKKSNNNGSNMARNLPVLAVHLQTLTESMWTGPHIAFVMFGLQNFDEKVKGYLSIVSSMNRVIKRASRCNVPFEFQDSAMALLGLQKNQLNDSESLDMLLNISSMIKVSNDIPLARTSANALYGLKAMNSASCQVQLLLSRLAESVQSCIEPFTSRNVGNALYGLQRMSCDDPEVLSLVTALVPKVQDCVESLNSQEIGNALYGLQGMRSNSREVRQLIAALVPKVQKCEGRFTAQTVGNALYGLQGMSSDDHEVGLLLTALVPKVQDCTESLNSQEIGNALYGLQGMRRSESLLRILCVIQREASSNIDFASLSAIELKSFGVFVALSMPWLRAVLDTSELLGWQRVEELLQESSRKCLTSSSVGARVVRHNSAERRVLTAADRLFGSSNIRVFNNIFLHQFFECDILIKVPISVRPDGGAGTGEGEEGEWLTVNIEVDGLQHARATNSRRDGLRDTYLGERGVVVKRVKSGSLSLMNDAQLNEWILEAASDAVLSRATAYES